jgi:predicted alpha-1,2-mannosidase
MATLVVVLAADGVPAHASSVGERVVSASAGPSPASLVDPFVGTGASSAVAGDIGTFPGAAVPFGMVQWSPDTSPDRIEGGGYSDADTSISGFSLTHLSGAGCPIYGDIPVLPVSGAVPADPGASTEAFSHADEEASPGRYRVSLGTPPVEVRLSATTRTGIGQFTFPSAGAADLLFKVSGSANGIIASSVQTSGSNEVTGSVESGSFCGTETTYTLHFVAEFDQPFTSLGVWDDTGLEPGTTACSGSWQTACGAWVTFDAPAGRTITMKVGVSYVSVANAAANLAAEDPGWSLSRVQARATRSWNSLLGRIDVRGGSRTEQEKFYTALYHSLLDPSVFSDDNGQYEGFDDRVHNAGRRIQYANFSEWDIYRSEIPLLSMIDPGQVSDMMQSLVNDAEQSGWLPTWTIANDDAGIMNGDSADPIIADAYAFGVRGFDAPAAFRAMLKGATRPGVTPDGVEERQDVTEFNQQGYVQADALSRSDLLAVGGSETLEYAIDDFAVAQMAEDLGHGSEYRTMMARAQDWQNLFNPATGYVQARQTDGSFPAGPVFQPYSAILQLAGVTQEGYQEGNAVQYTWSVPQNLGDLFALMGGGAAATSELDKFFTQLNAGPNVPYDWAGNEPSLWTPWEFDFAGTPWRTQQVVREIADNLYPLTPAGEPGNDDLGAMSSWYVWAALGLYPLTPGTANLVLSSPMFPRSTIHLTGGKVLTLTARGTPGVYVQSAVVSTGSGTPTPWQRPWLPVRILRTGGTVAFTLGPRAHRAWGAGAGSAPPSFREFSAPAVGYTLPSGAVEAHPSVVVPFTLGVRSDGSRATTVLWRASPSDGVVVTPTSGRFTLAATSSNGPPSDASTTLHLTTNSVDLASVRIVLSLPGIGATVPPVVLEINPPE